MAGTEIV
jgi:uncharacterized UBP type Zn finger protein